MYFHSLPLLLQTPSPSPSLSPTHNASTGSPAQQPARVAARRVRSTSQYTLNKVTVAAGPSLSMLLGRSPLIIMRVEGIVYNIYTLWGAPEATLGGPWGAGPRRETRPDDRSSRPIPLDRSSRPILLCYPSVMVIESWVRRIDPAGESLLIGFILTEGSSLLVVIS